MGLLLLCNGGFMLLATIASYAYKDGVTIQIALAALLTAFTGLAFMFFTREHTKELGKREGYIVVTFGWVFMSFSGTLPYIFSGAILDFTNAFFETISGYTTTGAVSYTHLTLPTIYSV